MNKEKLKELKKKFKESVFNGEDFSNFESFVLLNLGYINQNKIQLEEIYKNMMEV